jgi:hypothetical protein
VTIKIAGFIDTPALFIDPSSGASGTVVTEVPGPDSDLRSDGLLACGAYSTGLAGAVALVITLVGADAATCSLVSDIEAPCGQAGASEIEDVVSSLAPLTDPSFGFTASTSTGKKVVSVARGLTDNGALSALGFGLAANGTECDKEACSFAACVPACLSDWLNARTYQHLC